MSSAQKIVLVGAVIGILLAVDAFKFSNISNCAISR